MKQLLLFVFLASYLSSCSGSKEISSYDSNVGDKNYQNRYYQKKSYPTERAYKVEANSEEINTKANKIIEKYAGVSITDIARSKVFKTREGYEWKFTNVTTGENFEIQTDHNLQSVNIFRVSYTTSN